MPGQSSARDSSAQLRSIEGCLDTLNRQAKTVAPSECQLGSFSLELSRTFKVTSDHRHSLDVSLRKGRKGNEADTNGPGFRLCGLLRGRS